MASRDDGGRKFEHVAGREPFVRRWSNASQWPNGTLPARGSAPTILSAWTMELDIDPPPLGQVRVDGELRFDGFCAQELKL